MISFETEQKQTLNYGLRVFKVFVESSGVLHDKCPVCEDKRTISFPNVPGTYKCPVCDRPFNVAGSVHVHKYGVREYIINSCVITGPETLKAFAKKGVVPPVKVAWNGFAKQGTDIFKARFWEGDFLDWRKSFNPTREDPDARAFYTQEAAFEYIKALDDLQEKKLQEFNALHHTNHVNPFKQQEGE